jgi:hypothetical protein
LVSPPIKPLKVWESASECPLRSKDKHGTYASKNVLSIASQVLSEYEAGDRVRVGGEHSRLSSKASFNAKRRLHSSVVPPRGLLPRERSVRRC